METKEQILAILKEVKPNKNLENVVDIIEGGYIDSFELIALISNINEKYGIEVTIEDLIPENFNSVDAMTQLIERKIKQLSR